MTNFNALRHHEASGAFEAPQPGICSLPQWVEHWARHQPHARALVFLPEGDRHSLEMSYSELLMRAQGVANFLVAQGLQGERLLLLLPSGLDYVVAFLGCLMAKAIAVPLYPPRNNWHDTRLAAISNDAQAVRALTHSSLCDGLLKRMQQAGACTVTSLVAVDQVAPSPTLAACAEQDEQAIAYLQYTSGSTGNPKGVEVRQFDLVRNAELYSQAVGLRHGEVAVSWLPLFHDMGLVQGLVMPLAVGGTAVFMPPTAFVQDPMRWLRAIDLFRAVFSGGPNFAYQLCVDSQRAAATVEVFDLSCWRTALNAAEPISADTLQAFALAFAAQGLRRSALVGGYGMAEATLYVSAGASGQGAPILHLSKSELAEGRVRIADSASESTSALVSSGLLGADPTVRIVDPVTGLLLDPFRVGEIWVAGSSVCRAYWQNPQESSRTFGHTVSVNPGLGFLRTGDLGFVHEGHLYVTGRLKDLIIVRGANHYPQDIERSVESSQPAFRTGGYCAAFTLDDASDSPLVVVQEVKRTERRKVDIAQIGPRVASLVAAQQGIELGTLVLVEPAALPKTSSGKIQRKACRDLLLQGKLQEIARWQRARVTSVDPMQGPHAQDLASIETLLTTLVVELSGLPQEVCTRDARFNELGLDSAKLVLLTVRAGQVLGQSLPPSTLFEYPSIGTLANHLVGSHPQRRLSDTSLAQPVAIVGMACRVPGAANLQSFWDLLERGESAVGKISPQRRALTDYAAAEDAAHSCLGELPEVQAFDAQVFGISAREAISMDPQQRLTLETVWHALEDAGIAPSALAGSATGVYFGISTNDYFRMQGKAGHDAYSGTGGALSIAANRISYCLGLQGPSLALDTACSSSLVAVHQACQALGTGECDSAIAGGVNLVLSAEFGDIFAQAQMLSPDGRCKTFDAGANGYVRGEGVGAVVLKRLSDAQRDGDRIHAVIRGSAVNQDGRSNGLTAPNGLAQREVIRAALARAGVPAASIGYVETHGTGTPLGDPIEVAALKETYGLAGSSPCRLGALKTNIGHLEAAAGIAGLIKTVMVLERGRIPGNHGFEELNPHIDLTACRLEIAALAQDWPAPAHAPRRAGVSAFGFGGTNAHIVLESAAAPAQPGPASEAPAGTPLLLTLSAASAASLAALRNEYAQRLRDLPEAQARALCHSANRHRARLPERLAVLGDTVEQLVQALDQDPQALVGTGASGSHRRAAPGPRRIAFLFTGQGAQYPGMAVSLSRSDPVFRQHIEACDAILRPVLGAPLIDILSDAHGQYLNDTLFVQPALVAVELGMAQLWQRHGVTPDVLVGHSVGEYAAACFAGVMSLEDALTLVAERGRLMAAAPGCGAMLSVRASPAELFAQLPQLGLDLDVASHNGPEQFVLSGEVDAIERAQRALAAIGLDTQRLAVSHAFHSRLMDAILPAFEAATQRVTFHPARIPLLPSAPCEYSISEAAYWVQQLRAPVQFAEALRGLVAQGVDCLIETGPGRTLVDLGRRQCPGGDWIHSFGRSEADTTRWARALAEAFVAGADVTLPALSCDTALLEHLPLYAFDRQAFWFAKAQAGSTQVSMVQDRASAHWPGRKIDIALPGWHAYETRWPANGLDFFGDHRIDGQILMPGAGFVSLMLSAATAAGLNPQGAGLDLRSLELRSPLPLDAASPVHLQVVLLVAGEGTQVQVFARLRDTEGWTLHASAEIQALLTRSPADVLADPASASPRPIADFYAFWSACGLSYGPAFQALQSLSVTTDHAFARVDVTHAQQGPVLAPGWDSVVLDAAFQSLGGLLRDRLGTGPEMLMPLPVTIESLKLLAPLPGAVEVCTRLRASTHNSDFVVADLILSGPDGRACAQISGVRFHLVRRSAPVQPAPQASTVQWGGPAPALPPFAAPSPRLVVGEVDPALLAAGQAQLDCWPSQENLPALLRQIAHLLDTTGATAPGARLTLLVPLWPSLNCDAQILVAEATRLCMAAQALLCAIAESDLAPRLRLCWVTRQATGPDAGSSAACIAMAGVPGLLRSAAVELPHLDVRLLDLAEDASGADWRLALHALEVLDEPQLRVRNGVLGVPRLQPLPEIPRRLGQALDPQGAYLITGGTGTLGLAFSEWLVQAGARHLVLLSRTSQLDDQAGRRLNALRGVGVSVELVRGDVAQAPVVDELIRSFGLGRPPLRGVVHAAGVLKDRPLAHLGADDWTQVAQAKCAGAWQLERATREMALDFFVLCSSASSVLGSAGQANYAAANALLEAIGAYRRQQGRACTVVHWGPWAGSGMAGGDRVAEQMRQLGLAPMPAQAALQTFASLPLHSANALVMSCQPDRLLRQQPSAFRRALWHELPPAEGRQADAALPSAELLASLEAQPALHAMVQALGALVAIVLRQSALPGAQRPEALSALRLSDLGLDSLMAMDLRNRVRQWIGVDLPAHLLISGSSIGEVARLSYEQLLLSVIQIDHRAAADVPADEEVFVL